MSTSCRDLSARHRRASDLGGDAHAVAGQASPEYVQGRAAGVHHEALAGRRSRHSRTVWRTLPGHLRLKPASAARVGNAMTAAASSQRESASCRSTVSLRPMPSRAVFASSVVASQPTAFPWGTRRDRPHVETVSCVWMSTRQEACETVERSGRASHIATSAKLPQTQRIGRPPRYRPFRLWTVEVAEQQHSVSVTRAEKGGRRTPSA